ncbi:MAG: hypothetical protein ACJ8AO_20245 [Gemmatimonadaceae bacterium]
MATYTTRQMLERARAIFAARQGDARLTAQQQTACGTAVTWCDRQLGNLRADGTLAVNRRQQAYDDLKAAEGELNAAMLAHPEIAAPDFYDAIDLAQALASCLLEGRPSESLVLSDGL